MLNVAAVAIGSSVGATQRESHGAVELADVEGDLGVVVEVDVVDHGVVGQVPERVPSYVCVRRSNRPTP